MTLSAFLLALGGLVTLVLQAFVRGVMADGADRLCREQEEGNEMLREKYEEIAARHRDDSTTASVLDEGKF